MIWHPALPLPPIHPTRPSFFIKNPFVKINLNLWGINKGVYVNAKHFSIEGITIAHRKCYHVRCSQSAKNRWRMTAGSLRNPCKSLSARNNDKSWIENINLGCNGAACNWGHLHFGSPLPAGRLAGQVTSNTPHLFQPAGVDPKRRWPQTLPAMQWNTSARSGLALTFLVRKWPVHNESRRYEKGKQMRGRLPF
jgi:hypothetical protein